MLAFQIYPLQNIIVKYFLIFGPLLTTTHHDNYKWV
jgi:hypothetical protein